MPQQQQSNEVSYGAHIHKKPPKKEDSNYMRRFHVLQNLSAVRVTKQSDFRLTGDDKATHYIEYILK